MEEFVMADKVKARLVTGLFKSKVAAEAAVDALIKRGFTRDDISVLMSDETRSKHWHRAHTRLTGSVSAQQQAAPLAQCWRRSQLSARRCSCRV
jgi:hypothetical protein